MAIAGDAKGGRGTRKLTITVAGRKAVKGWLCEDLTSIASATPDPIRTRCAFLPLLELEEALTFLAGALVATEKALSDATAQRERRLEEGQGLLQHLVSEGVLYELKARTDWLRLMSNHLSEQRKDKPKRTIRQKQPYLHTLAAI